MRKTDKVLKPRHMPTVADKMLKLEKQAYEYVEAVVVGRSPGKALRFSACWRIVELALKRKPDVPLTKLGVLERTYEEFLREAEGSETKG